MGNNKWDGYNAANHSKLDQINISVAFDITLVIPAILGHTIKNAKAKAAINSFITLHHDLNIKNYGMLISFFIAKTPGNASSKVSVSGLTLIITSSPAIMQLALSANITKNVKYSKNC